MEKIVEKQEFVEIRDKLRKENKKIILCHGVFDLLHPGHIQHFQEAKELGDILVVSVTAARYVRKGPDRPYFNDRLRMESLAAIACIDYVILSESYTVDDIVGVVQPAFYVKGQEYKKAEDDITGKITEEVELVRKYGGDIYYTNGEVFSSTKLINQVFPVFSKELKDYLNQFKYKWSIHDINQYLHQAENLKILVIGDIIIDDYVFCKMQGLMSKNNGYSAKLVDEEKYLGGSVAIARHLSAFNKNITLMSIMGCEPELKIRMEEECQGRIELNLVTSPKYATIIKKRYVEKDDKRKELNKIFVVNNLPEKMEIEETILVSFKEKLKSEIINYDVVFLCDFGHGLIDGEVMELIQESAKKIVLNCQTNSSNYGLNLITKYRKADYFSLDEKELRLAFSDYKRSGEELLIELSNRLQARGWLTRGSKGALSVENGILCSCPAFVLDVLDTIGAGDAFFSIAGLMAAADAPLELGTFMGNVAGALATNIIGNKNCLDKVDVMKFVATLLKG